MLDDYRLAPSGDGPHAFTWKDKPHRLVYDLVRIATNLRNALRPFIDATSLHVSVTEDEMAAAITAVNLTPPEWSNDWPQSEGWYWVIGYAFSKPRSPDDAERLYTMEVKRIGTAGGQPGSLCYLVSGNFAYPGSAGPCRFQRIPNPV